jgi:hypothetical protein
MENVIETVVSDVKKAEAELEKVVAPLFPAAKAMRIDITDVEKVVIRTLECSYLRTVQDAQCVAQAMEAYKTQYAAKLKEITEKYVKDGEYAWDEFEAAFKFVAKKL